jgi:hypothetical protein
VFLVLVLVLNTQINQSSSPQEDQQVHALSVTGADIAQFYADKREFFCVDAHLYVVIENEIYILIDNFGNEIICREI